MGIQRKPKACLIEEMKSLVRGRSPEATGQAKPLSLPTPHDSQPDLVDKK